MELRQPTADERARMQWWNALTEAERAQALLWNTTYLQRALDSLKRHGYHPTPGDLAHLSPLGWEHINLTGDYHWETASTLGPDQFRLLRTRVQSYAAAA